MRRLFSVVVVATLWILLGCGGSSGGGGPKIAVSPTQVTATAGGASVSFTATLTGASDAISWALSGPGSLSTTSGASTTYTPPASVAATTTATLTASAGAGLSASATLTLQPPPTITVAGHVSDGVGRPRAGIHVVIGDAGVDSDVAGAFSIAGVTTPYDLITIADDTKTVGVYQGLTRPDPTVPSLARLTQAYFGMVTGTVRGGDGLTAPGHHTMLAWGSPETRRTDPLTSNAYSFTLEWVGPTSSTGTLHALQWATVGVGPPASYVAYGKTENITVANGGATSIGTDVTMAGPLSAAHLTGTLTAPATYDLIERDLVINFPDGAAIQLEGDTSPSGTFDWLVPVGTDGDFQVSVSAYDGTAGALSFGFIRGLAPGTSDVAVDLPAAVQLLSPEDGGTLVSPATTFSWTAAPGVHSVTIEGSEAGDISYFLFTTGTSTHIPDLTAHGYGLSTSYQWSVSTISPFASVDEFVGSASHVPSGNTEYDTFSPGRTFVTTPAD